MGFHEDDRIRNKNSSYTQVSIIDNDINLRLSDVSVSEFVKFLTNNGYLVELKPDQVLSVSRKSVYEAKINNDNRIVGSL
jgi:hypothetical protein